MIKNRISVDQICWFYHDKKTYPYIYNNDMTKIKLLNSGEIIPLESADSYYEYDNRATRKALVERYGTDIEFFESDIAFQYLNFFEWLLVSEGKDYSKVELTNQQINLMTNFVERNYERMKRREAKKQSKEMRQAEREFDERDF